MDNTISNEAYQMNSFGEINFQRAGSDSESREQGLVGVGGEQWSGEERKRQRKQWKTQIDPQ